MADENADVALFTATNVPNPAKVAGNAKLAGRVKEVITLAGAEGGCDARQGALLLRLATKFFAHKLRRALPVMVKHVMSGGIRLDGQVEAAVKFMKRQPESGDVDYAALDAFCGVGVDPSEEEIAAAVAAGIEAHRDELLEGRYSVAGNVLREVKSGPMEWADGKILMARWNAAILELLGPKTDADKQGGKKGGKKKGGKKKGGKKGGKQGGKVEEEAVSADTIAVGFEARDISSAINSPQLLAEHAKATGGMCLTRFPPEPNGFLHIGHAKSMHLNFKTAFEQAGRPGHTYFRYDDTNPLAETQEFIDSQAENVAWMGWKPWKVTFSSDYFQELYDLAIKLIKLGKAYVCHQSKADIERSRAIGRARKGGDPNSPWRNRTVEENLREFEKMRMGMYGEGEATLRMKIDNTHVNPCMWDPVAYRVMFVPHLRTGDKWCIYPSYDYTHCIVDSLEHIDYSLCTLEFEVRRDSYYWLLEALDLWRPHVWEFSRLNITYTLMSKRRLLKLVNTGKVRGWDDPRICTIDGLRRRGYRPEAINAFCAEVGVTRKDNVIEYERLEACARSDLDDNARRAFVVQDPVKVVLTNMAEDWAEEIVCPNFPKDKARGRHAVDLNRVVYMERSDFHDVDSKGFYGLAPGKTVGLRYAGLITCDEVVRGAGDKIIELRCTYAPRGTVKVKGNIHWVCGATATTAPLRAEMRLYNQLFDLMNPAAASDWEDHIQADSEIISTGICDKSLAGVRPLDCFQFERVGYFVCDKDTRDNLLVFNRTVSLRESTNKKRMK